MKLTVTAESFPIDGAFTISRGTRTEAQVLTVTVERDGVTGRAECVPYARYGESLDSVTAQIEGLPAEFDRAALQGLLPAGAARNAVDCALWDWEAKAEGRPAWQLAGLAAPEPVTTAFTLSLDSPDAMRAKAAENRHRPLLKIKLGGAGDLDRLRAVREGAPGAQIIVDANESWTPGILMRMAEELPEIGVAMIEQPLPAGEDAFLREAPKPIPLCADESCHDRASLPDLAGKYDMINIKLDKTGGLTEALALRAAAEAAGFGIMVGCMLGSSLAMAPALLVAQGARVVDLDGPLLLARDRAHALRYEQSLVHPAERALWG
ncbi:MAG: dipeptide epimerase [Alphaproteobacteria bacterium]|nr:MAG: dipeptide epimerase [Alphaproteobacteria bacterium]